MRILMPLFTVALILGSCLWRTEAVSAQTGTQTYSVSGRVEDISLWPNAPRLSGITLVLSGTVSATTQTDANGNYSFSNLPADGTYTITPTTPGWVYDAPFTFTTFGGGTRELFRIIAAQPMLIRFSSATYTGYEGSEVWITVERGFVVGTSSVDYTTTDGTATAGSDYPATSGTIRFNPGETTKTFIIPITYDATVEPGETINIALSNPTNGQFRGPTTTVVTINDPFPALVTEGSSLQAAAVNAVTRVRDPFSLYTPSGSNSNEATRVALFARYIDFMPGEPTSVVTAQAFDSQFRFYELPVEFVGRVPNLEWLTQINVKLPNDLPSGTIWVIIRLRNMGSAQARIRIK